MLVIAGLLLGLVAVMLTARQVRLPVLVAVLGAQQLVLHHVFASASEVVVGCASGHQALHVAADFSASGSGTTPGCSAWGPGLGAEQAGTPGWLMLAAHALATFLTAWLFVRGEARLWALARRAIATADLAPSGWPHAPGRPDLPALTTVVLAAPACADAAPRAPPPALVVS
jgi:hypothetical protein